MITNRLSPLHLLQYEDVLRRALVEDLGRGGDLTTDAVIAPEQSVSCRVVSRGVGVVAGLEPAAEVFRMLDGGVDVGFEAVDGDAIVPDQPLISLRGSARAILSGERTALNILAFMSGTATLTRAYVDAVAGTGAHIVCTRKTVPGLRVLQKYAVRCGGGWNHRFALDDAVLIKDNHLAAAGGVAASIERVRRSVGHTVKVELEVDDLEQLAEGLEHGVDAVLLDNMDADRLRRAVEMVDGRAVTEASGGMTLANVAEIAATGVDLISVGALTHSAPALDLSMECATVV